MIDQEGCSYEILIRKTDTDGRIVSDNYFPDVGPAAFREFQVSFACRDNFIFIHDRLSDEYGIPRGPLHKVLRFGKVPALKKYFKRKKNKS